MKSVLTAMTKKKKVMLSSEKQSNEIVEKENEKCLLISIEKLAGRNVFCYENEITNEGLYSSLFSVVFAEADKDFHSNRGKYQVCSQDKRVGDLIDAMLQIETDALQLLFELDELEKKVSE